MASIFVQKPADVTKTAILPIYIEIASINLSWINQEFLEYNSGATIIQPASFTLLRSPISPLCKHQYFVPSILSVSFLFLMQKI